MLGFIGGTGPEGKGLALRFAISGINVFIGFLMLQNIKNPSQGFTGILLVW